MNIQYTPTEMAAAMGRVLGRDLLSTTPDDRENTLVLYMKRPISATNKKAVEWVLRTSMKNAVVRTNRANGTIRVRQGVSKQRRKPVRLGPLPADQFEQSPVSEESTEEQIPLADYFGVGPLGSDEPPGSSQA